MATIKVEAQPQLCQNPASKGFPSLGDFNITPYACVGDGEVGTPIHVKSLTRWPLETDVEFYFNFTDDIDIRNTSGTPASDESREATKQMPPGEYWVLQKATLDTVIYVRCKKVEVIDSKRPVVKMVKPCDPANPAIEILQDPKNVLGEYVVDFGNGDPPITKIPDNFPQNVAQSSPQPASRISVSRKVYRGGVSVCTSDETIINLDSAVPPEIHKLISSNGGQSTALEFTTPGHFAIEQADENGSSFSPVGNSGSGSFRIDNLDPAKTYCYRLNGKNACDVALQPSNTVCEIGIEAELTNTKTTKISWVLPNSPAISQLGLNKCKLFREKQVCIGCQTSLIGNLKGETSPYIDNTLDCSQEYIYNIVLNYPTTVNYPSGLTIVSEDVLVNPMSISGQGTPDGVLLASYSPINSNLVDLNVLGATLNTGSQYRFLKKGPSDKDYMQIGGDSPNNNTTDNVAQPEIGPYCYKYQYEDDCGIFTKPSEPSCTVFLKSKDNVLNWGKWLLQSSPLVVNSQNYEVLLYDNSSGGFLPVSNSKTDKLKYDIDFIVDASTEPVLRFRLIAFQDISDPAVGYIYHKISYSNILEFSISPTVIVPMAFSPKSDIPENRTLTVFSKFVSSGTIQIYNRWGYLVYVGDVLEQGKAWNGKFMNNGSELPTGTYNFRINGQDESGQTFTRAGSVLMLR